MSAMDQLVIPGALVMVSTPDRGLPVTDREEWWHALLQVGMTSAMKLVALTIGAHSTPAEPPAPAGSVITAPGLATLMHETGYSRTHAQRQISELRSTGWLVTLTRPAAGRSARYLLSVPEAVARTGQVGLAGVDPSDGRSGRGVGERDVREAVRVGAGGSTSTAGLALAGPAVDVSISDDPAVGEPTVDASPFGDLVGGVPAADASTTDAPTAGDPVTGVPTAGDPAADVPARVRRVRKRRRRPAGAERAAIVERRRARRFGGAAAAADAASPEAAPRTAPAPLTAPAPRISPAPLAAPGTAPVPRGIAGLAGATPTPLLPVVAVPGPGRPVATSAVTTTSMTTTGSAVGGSWAAGAERTERVPSPVASIRVVPDVADSTAAGPAGVDDPATSDLHDGSGGPPDADRAARTASETGAETGAEPVEESRTDESAGTAAEEPADRFTISARQITATLVAAMRRAPDESSDLAGLTARLRDILAEGGWTAPEIATHLVEVIAGGVMVGGDDPVHNLLWRLDRLPRECGDCPCRPCQSWRVTGDTGNRATGASPGDRRADHSPREAAAARRYGPAAHSPGPARSADPPPPANGEISTADKARFDGTEPGIPSPPELSAIERAAAAGAEQARIRREQENVRAREPARARQNDRQNDRRRASGAA